VTPTGASFEKRDCSRIVAESAVVRGSHCVLTWRASPSPLTFTAIPLLLLAVAVLAVMIAAVRASRVEPIIALRSE
jgi:ABC-type antimicrobial peptide transport system permease subunit